MPRRGFGCHVLSTVIDRELVPDGGLREMKITTASHTTKHGKPRDQLLDSTYAES